MQKQQTLVTSLQDSGTQLTETNAIYRSQIKKMEDKLDESKQEILKGNNIIEKQQGEYKQLKQKMKTLQAKMAQLEQTIAQKQSQIEEKASESNTIKEA